MSKDTSRKRDKSEVDHLRGRIRELESEVKQLMRQLRYYEKRSTTTSLEEIKPFGEPKIKPVKLQPCESCGKGHYNEFELMGKVFGTCNIEACGHRKRLK